MSQVLRSLGCLVGLALVSGCGVGTVDTDLAGIEASGQGVTTAFASTYPSVYLRGSMNGWKKTAMKLVSDHQWEGEAVFPAGSGLFKFDVYGNWSVNFGDDDLDQTADAYGANIAVAGGKTYRISFNDESRFYWIEEKTYAATVVLQLPAGVDRQAFAGQQARFARDGEPAWSVGLYVDSDHTGPYCPLPGLSKGSSYTFSLDLILGGKRYVTQKTFTVDGKVDDKKVTAKVTEASLAGYGTVELSVLADAWQSGALASNPCGEIDVFLGDWQAGNRLGRTGTDGKVTLTLPAGEQRVTVFTMTSSHSVASGSTSVTVQAGRAVAAEVHLASLTVVVRAHYDCGTGNALYLSGASSYLGDWKTALKMAYDPSAGAWVFQGNLPVGLPFKIVRGPWVDGVTTSTTQLSWELGADRVVTPPVGYYQTELDAYPAF